MGVKNTLESLKNLFFVSRDSGNYEAVLLRKWIDEKNEEAFTEIYNTYRSDIFSCVKRMVSDPSQADEITQEVFSMLVLEQEKFRKVIKLKKYLIGIAVYKIKEIYRNDKKNVWIEEVAEDNFSDEFRHDLFDELVFKNLDDQLWNVVSKLNPKYKMAYIMSYEGFTNEEIAEKLSISAKAAANVIYRSHTTVRDEMKKIIQGGKA